MRRFTGVHQIRDVSLSAHLRAGLSSTVGDELNPNAKHVFSMLAPLRPNR